MAETFLFSVSPVDNKTIPLIGRNEVLEKIKERVLNYCNISIIGDTMIGKSSLLKTLENDFSDAKYSNKIIPVYINFEKFAYDITGEMLLDRVLRNVYRSSTVLSNEFKDYSWGKSHEFSEVIETCKFNDLIILLLLDNFDNIPILKKLDNDFWTHLRSNANEKGLSIVTASRSGIETLCHKGDIVNSHFWGIFTFINISVFDKQDFSLELLSRGIESDKIKNIILSNVGNHPCFLKVAANTVIQNEFSDSHSEKVIVNAIYNNLLPYYNTCYNQLEKDEKNVDNGVHYKLEYLSMLNTICSSKINDTSEKREITNLKQLGYIYANAEGILEISSPLFARYLKEVSKPNNDNKPDKPESYNGTEPYIFVSYAHADSEIVFSQIDKLQKNGYRVWYDYGIPGSAKWRKVIDEKIEKCSKFIFYVSKSSATSEEVHKEIRKFVEDRGKKRYNNDFIMMLLEDLKKFKSEIHDDIVFFVVDECNGISFSNDESIQNKMFEQLGEVCKE